MRKKLLVDHRIVSADLIPVNGKVILRTPEGEVIVKRDSDQIGEVIRSEVPHIKPGRYVDLATGVIF